jgi:hypothetical protein
MFPYRRPKDVHVCAYVRMRFNRLEHVRQHWRSHPNQFSFDF